jgi:hypothetical protein
MAAQMLTILGEGGRTFTTIHSIEVLLLEYNDTPIADIRPPNSSGLSLTRWQLGTIWLHSHSTDPARV